MSGDPSKLLPAIDPDDPRAPSQEVWDRLTDAERARVLAALPSDFPVSEASPPEGDPHFDAKVGVRDVLRRHFRKVGGGVYVGCDLPVYYPGERMFSPDIMAVTGVDPHFRDHWVVSHEGKGLDLALEILYLGSAKKDLRANLTKFARLGIREYFVFDRRRLSLRGFRLAGGDQPTYASLAPRAGRLRSEVLALELAVDADRVRFYSSLGPLQEADELIDSLGAMVDRLIEQNESEAERAQAEAERAQAEAERAQAEAERADDAERRLAEALAELERLRRS